MEQPPLVSIIMNCHNSDRFLRQAIDSVYAQTYTNWELIFWNNASTDDSGIIAQSYDERIKYFLATKKTSLGEARNLALKKATGKYIAFLDCDDLYFPEKIEKQVQLMEKGNYVLSYGSAVIINEHAQEIKRMSAKNKSGNIFGALLNHYEINMQSVMLLHSFLIEEQLSFLTNLQYCPDHNLFMEIASHNPVGVVQDFIVKYRILQDSLSKKTLYIAGSEVRFTLDSIAKKSPELKEKFKEEFNQAYGKSNYYDVVAAIYNNDRKQARKKLQLLTSLKYEYLFLYLLLFLPLPNRIILKLLGR